MNVDWREWNNMLEYFRIFYKHDSARIGAKSEKEAIERFITMYQRYLHEQVEPSKLQVVPLGRSKH